MCFMFQVALDLCRLEPCLNDATCMMGAYTNYTCVCAEGWEGDYCETLIDSCDVTPCANAAPCIPLINDFFCV